MRTPRERSHFCSAPATVASTTSLTVPPSAFFTRLKSASSWRTQTSRRCGPISTLSGVSGAGFMPGPHDLAEPLERLARLLQRLGRGGSPRRPDAPPSRAGARRGRARRARPCRAGSASAAGSTARSGCATGAGSGVRSNSTVARSTPETPSTSAWCVLVMSAKRPPSRPWTSHISHSGLERSSAWECTRAASARSCASEPGAGSAVSRTWYSRLKLGSSTHSGRPVSSGGKASFWRKRGTRCRRAADVVGEPVVVGRRALEDHHRADVHVGGRALLRDERGVHRGQPVSVLLRHGLSL